MSMSSFMSALRSAGRQQLTASTIARRQATGSHLLRIEGYKQQVRDMAPNGKSITSSKFAVGGHDWQLKLFPNGIKEEVKGSISLFLCHASLAKTGEATAKFEFSVLDQDGKPWHGRNVERHHFQCSDYYDSCWGFHDFVKIENLDQGKHLKDDCLNVLCDVTVDLGLNPEDYVEVAPAPVAAPPPFDVSREDAGTVWNKHEADLKVEVGGETFAAHRWALERSPVFKDLMASSTGELRIDDMDADVCKALLRFMYTGSPPEPEQLEESTMPERMLVAADRHKQEKLKQICEEPLCKRVDMGSVGATLAFAERHRCSVLREACVQFLSVPGNLKALMETDGFEQLKTGCPSSLMELMVQQMP